MTNIQLTIKNESDDSNYNSLVIFQKNDFENNNEYGSSNIMNAWKIIEDSSTGMAHTIEFSNDIEIAIQDEWYNSSPRQKCLPGDSFKIKKGKQGPELVKAKQSASIENNVSISSTIVNTFYNCNIYRNGKVLMGATRIALNDVAKFALQPKIYIGVVSQLAEGDIINSAIFSDINSEFNLKGIKSADIIMRGGGTGKESKPYTFDLVIKEEA